MKTAYITDTSLPNGTPIAKLVRDLSANEALRAYNVKTLADLLSALGAAPPPSFSMLRSAASLLCSYFNAPAQQISLDSIEHSRQGFRSFLETKRYKDNSIRSYVNLFGILLKTARGFGWNPLDEISTQWHALLASSEKMIGADLVEDMARIGKTPSQVTIDDVDDWVRQQTMSGRSYRHTCIKRNHFWRLLVDSGSTYQNPQCIVSPTTVGIPLKQLPPGLQADALKLLTWKSADFSLNRPKKGKHRRITSKHFETGICSIAGFALTIRGNRSIDSLSQLVTEPTICGFVEWMVNERRVQPYCVRNSLMTLYGAMRQHPSWSSVDLGWFKKLLVSLPGEDRSEIRKRKALKYLEYEVVESIPLKIRAQKESTAKRDMKKAALLAVEELIMKWLIILPWRQRNLRECRVNGSNPNLFRAKIPPFSDIDKPEWVKVEERTNPNAEFWQFRFSKDETKTGINVHAILPRPLIGLLEEYLQLFRPHLLRVLDPCTLFLNETGTPLEDKQVITIVGTRTLRHGGRRVTPHLFRDIVAYTWLKEHPADYLTLSKMLWHKNISTTIYYYGSRFNESSGVVAMESWVEERETKSK